MDSGDVQEPMPAVESSASLSDGAGSNGIEVVNEVSSPEKGQKSPDEYEKGDNNDVAKAVKRVSVGGATVFPNSEVEGNQGDTGTSSELTPRGGVSERGSVVLVIGSPVSTASSPLASENPSPRHQEGNSSPELGSTDIEVSGMNGIKPMGLVVDVGGSFSATSNGGPQVGIGLSSQFKGNEGKPPLPRSASSVTVPMSAARKNSSMGVHMDEAVSKGSRGSVLSGDSTATTATVTLSGGRVARLESAPRASNTLLWLLPAGLGGVEFCYAAQASFVTPLFLTLGVPYATASLFWLAGPLVAMVVQPIVGVASDRCTSGWGRRRPFLALFTAAIVGGSFALALAAQGTGGTAAIVAAFIAFFLTDLGLDSVQLPMRALVQDAAALDQVASATANLSVLSGVGSLAGYAIGGANLLAVLPFLGSQAGAVFFVCAFVFLAAACVTMFSRKEPVLVVISGSGSSSVHGVALREPEATGNEAEGAAAAASKDVVLVVDDAAVAAPVVPSSLTANGRSSPPNSPPVANGSAAVMSSGGPESGGDGQEGAATPGLLARLKNSLLSMPHGLWTLFFAHMTGYAGVFSFLYFSTDWLATAVFEGDPVAEAGSEERLNYDEGLRVGSLGLGGFALVCILYSFALPGVIRNVGLRNSFSLGVGLPAIIALCGGVFGGPSTVALGVTVMASMGLAYATMLVVPYTILAGFTADETKAPEEDDDEDDLEVEAVLDLSHQKLDEALFGGVSVGPASPVKATASRVAGTPHKAHGKHSNAPGMTPTAHLTMMAASAPPPKRKKTMTARLMARLTRMMSFRSRSTAGADPPVGAGSVATSPPPARSVSRKDSTVSSASKSSEGAKGSDRGGELLSVMNFFMTAAQFLAAFVVSVGSALTESSAVPLYCSGGLLVLTVVLSLKVTLPASFSALAREQAAAAEGKRRRRREDESRKLSRKPSVFESIGNKLVHWASTQPAVGAEAAEVHTSHVAVIPYHPRFVV